MKNLLILLLTVAFIVSSCSVQKRRYNKGYDVSFRKSPTKTGKNAVVLEKKTDNSVIEPRIENVPENELVVSSGYRGTADAVFRSQIGLNTATDSCDIIYLKNHQIIKAKVIEINKTEIKYKRCDNLSGPLIVIDKNEVQSIRYKNGFSEEFPISGNEQQIKPKSDFLLNKEKGNSDDREYDGYSIASLVCGILGVFILFTAIPAVICGIIGLRNIRESNYTLKGRAMATIGLVLGIIVILIFFLVLVTLLAMI